MRFFLCSNNFFLFCLSTLIFILRPVNPSCPIYFPRPQQYVFKPTYLRPCLKFLLYQVTYFPLPPNQSLFTPAYLLPGIFDLHPSIYVLPVGGGGGLVLLPLPPHAPSTPLFLSILVRGVGVVTRPPSRNPDSTVSVSPWGGGWGGWCCDHAPLVQPRFCCLYISWWGGMVL